MQTEGWVVDDRTGQPEDYVSEFSQTQSASPGFCVYSGMGRGSACMSDVYGVANTERKRHLTPPVPVCRHQCGSYRANSASACLGKGAAVIAAEGRDVGHDRSIKLSAYLQLRVL